MDCQTLRSILDCCLETDNATCIIVTSAERARDLKQHPVYIMAVQGRGTEPGGEFYYQHGPITRTAGYHIAPRVFGMAGITAEDVDVTGCYDAFTYTANPLPSRYEGTIVRGKPALWAHHDDRPCLVPPDWSGGYTSLYAMQQGEQWDEEQLETVAQQTAQIRQES